MVAEKAGMKKRILKIVGYVATVLSIAFIARTLLNMDIDLSMFPSIPKLIGFVLIFVLITLLQYVLQGYAWKRLLEFIGEKKIAYLPVLTVYLKANIGKYLPGNVMHFAGRNLLGEQLRMRQGDIALATVAEIVLMGIAAVLLSMVLAFQELQMVMQLIWDTTMYRVVFLVVCGIGVLAVIVFAVTLWKRKTFREKYGKLLSFSFVRAALPILLVYLFNFMVFGLIFVWIFQAILGVPVPLSNYFPTIALTILSWLAGHIVPGVPGGIGVREAISILLLNNMYGTGMATLASLVSRVVSILTDVVAFLVALLLGKRAKENETESSVNQNAKEGELL